jgi:hypothetical protein
LDAHDLLLFELRPLTLHPNASALYKAKLEQLGTALNDPGIAAEAGDVMRDLIERIVLTPADGALKIELWRYERALERRGLPIASQAGKGLFRRQEVQDLLALTRALADAGDTLAFGAWMRGPFVGLTEDELLDITAALPAHSERPEALPRFSVLTDPALISHPTARKTFSVLRDLRRRSRATTPMLLLSEAGPPSYRLPRRRTGQAQAQRWFACSREIFSATR